MLFVQTPPWPEQYKAFYFYTTKQLGRQSPASVAGHVPYYLDVNAAPPPFSEDLKMLTLKMEDFG